MSGPQSGAGRRAKGVRAEVEAVRWLRETGIAPEARRYLAGDGRQPGDLDALPGLTIDVKNRDGWRVREWMDQAEAEAGDYRLAVVWARLERVPDPGDWPILIRARDFFTLYLDSDAQWRP